MKTIQSQIYWGVALIVGIQWYIAGPTPGGFACILVPFIGFVYNSLKQIK